MIIPPRFASAESANEIIPLYADDVRGVVYIPSLVDIQSGWTGGMDLYCQKVFIKKNDVSILPEEFHFARGVIDCRKFHVTLARDDVFRDEPSFHAIRELIGTQIMGHFRKLANAAAIQASLMGRTSGENKSEIASLRLQTVFDQYHMLFKHILVQKTVNGQRYRFEDKFLTDFENSMPFQSSERVATSIPDYLARMQALGHERELLILHPDEDYVTLLKVAQAEKREFILVRMPVEEDYLRRYAQITDIKIVPAAKKLRGMLEVQPATTSENEGWQIILKFFQDRLDHQEMSLTASLAEFDPLSVAGRLLMDEDSEGMRRWKELFEAMKADKTIDKNDPMFKYLDMLKQKIPYSLYINTRNPVLERLANLLQRRIDVDTDVILHSIFHDIAIASGYPLPDSHVAEYHNKVYMESLVGVEARVDNRRLLSKLGETQNSLEDAQDEVERLKSASSVSKDAGHTTNEVFFIRPMHITDFDHDLVSKKLAEICQRLELKLIDPKKLNLPGDILKEIVEYLGRSRLVVADVSEISNANVYYEVGFVYGSYPKKLILVAHQTVANQTSLRLPINIATQRVLPYDDKNARQFDEFQTELETVMKGLLVTI